MGKRYWKVVQGQQKIVKKKILTRSGMIDVPHACEYSMVNTPFSYSPLVQEDMLHLGQLSVYKDAAQTFTRFCTGQINPSQFQRVVQHYGSTSEYPEV